MTPVDPESSQPMEASPAELAAFAYHSHFQDCMEMTGDTGMVSTYLNAHQGWFRRCAQPMQVQTLSDNAYALSIGRFGALGYEVEPKIGLNLLPQEDNSFQIVTIPLPEVASPDYAVDFQAVMNLFDQTSPTGSAITHVQWELDLTVSMRFPRFIYRLPTGVIQTTGDRVLKQIVRQVSRRLTFRVQQDFHTTHDLPMPKRSQKA